MSSGVLGPVNPSGLPSFLPSSALPIRSRREVVDTIKTDIAVDLLLASKGYVSSIQKLNEHYAKLDTLETDNVSKDIQSLFKSKYIRQQSKEDLVLTMNEYAAKAPNNGVVDNSKKFALDIVRSLNLDTSASLKDFIPTNPIKKTEPTKPMPVVKPVEPKIEEPKVQDKPKQVEGKSSDISRTIWDLAGRAVETIRDTGKSVGDALTTRLNYDPVLPTHKQDATLEVRASIKKEADEKRRVADAKATANTAKLDELNKAKQEQAIIDSKLAVKVKLENEARVAQQEKEKQALITKAAELKLEQSKKAEKERLEKTRIADEAMRVASAKKKVSFADVPPVTPPVVETRDSKSSLLGTAAKSVVSLFSTKASSGGSPERAAYLRGIAGTSMLGYQEVGDLAKLIERPIIVLRSESGLEANARVDSSYDTNPEHAGNAPLYVINYGNYHFEGFVPNNDNIRRPGETCSGAMRPGDYTNSGVNDCLIASIRSDAAANALLNRSGLNQNKDIRAHLVNAQQNNHANYYIPDNAEIFQTTIVRGFDAIPAGYNGFVIIQDNGPDGIVSSEGTIKDGVKVGQWAEQNEVGKFDVNYNDAGNEVSRVQEFRRDELLRLLPM
jgi:hypothetical protein